MILIIKTKGTESSIGLANKEKLTDQYSWKSEKNLSKELLPKIKWFLNKNDVQTRQITGVIVYLGPGSFTSLRIGVTAVNILAYSLNIPVVGVKEEEAGNRRHEAGDNDLEELLEMGLKKLKKAKVGEYLVPFYGKEPNITKPKNAKNLQN